MSKAAIFATWGDVPHLDEKAKAELAASYLPHERDARTKGVPSLGAGAIYPVPESDILCDPFKIPDYFRQCYALDVGWKRTAVLWGAWDEDADILYLYAEHYRGQAEPFEHAQAILAKGRWIPGVIDPAARGRGQKDGDRLLTIYRELLPNLTVADHAVHAGIYAVWSRLSTGRIKVFRTLQNFLAEYRIYRRDENGEIVKENDHLMDDLRYMVLSGLAVACVRPPEQWLTGRGQTPGIAYEYDPFQRT